MGGVPWGIYICKSTSFDQKPALFCVKYGIPQAGEVVLGQHGPRDVYCYAGVSLAL